MAISTENSDTKSIRILTELHKWLDSKVRQAKTESHFGEVAISLTFIGGELSKAETHIREVKK